MHEGCDAQLLLFCWGVFFSVVGIVPLLDSLHRVTDVVQHFQVAPKKGCNHEAYVDRCFRCNNEIHHTMMTYTATAVNVIAFITVAE